MDINELTVGQLKTLQGLCNRLGDTNAGDDATPYEIGKCYLIRTVTFFHIGKLTAVYRGELILSDAAWVADTGKWSKAMQEGPDMLDEVEMHHGPVIVSRSAIVDAVEWKHPLPTETK